MIILKHIISGLKIKYKEGNGILNDIFKDSSIPLSFYDKALSVLFCMMPALFYGFSSLALQTQYYPSALVPVAYFGGKESSASFGFTNPCWAVKAMSPSKQPGLKALALLPYSLTSFGFFPLTWTWHTCCSRLFKWNVTAMQTIVKYYFQYFFGGQDLLGSCLKLYYLIK